MKPGFDIIGDVHGHYSALCRLLERLGYQPCAQRGYYHPNRRLIFVGDLVDYGPQQQQTLQLVRRLLEQGDALAVMGNHEFNLVGFHRRGPAGYLRPHSEKNCRQHQAVLEQYHQSPAALEEELTWLARLPLYLDLPGFRVIHACWHPAHLKRVQPLLDQDNRLLPDAWDTAYDPQNPVSDSINVLLKGPSVTLPEPHQIRDKNGQQRNNPRARWWLPSPQSYRHWAILPQGPGQLPDHPVEQDFPGYIDNKPLFNGHYWLSGALGPRQSNLACVDYSGNRQLACYRWQGEEKLTSAHFVAENYDASTPL